MKCFNRHFVSGLLIAVLSNAGVGDVSFKGEFIRYDFDCGTARTTLSKEQFEDHMELFEKYNGGHIATAINKGTLFWNPGDLKRYLDINLFSVFYAQTYKKNNGLYETVGDFRKENNPFFDPENILHLLRQEDVFVEITQNPPLHNKNTSKTSYLYTVLDHQEHKNVFVFLEPLLEERVLNTVLEIKSLPRIVAFDPKNMSYLQNDLGTTSLFLTENLEEAREKATKLAQQDGRLSCLWDIANRLAAGTLDFNDPQNAAVHVRPN